MSQRFDQRTIGELQVEEFENMVRSLLGSSPSAQERAEVHPQQNHPKYVYGLNGLAELFGCRKQTAFNIKKSGRIAPAIKQVGRLLIIDADLALELACRKTGGRKGGGRHGR